MPSPPRGPEKGPVDPLSYGTPGQRLKAARERAGYSTRQAFVDDLSRLSRERGGQSVMYATVNSWDNGTRVPSQQSLALACELVDYSMDEILSGVADPAREVRRSKRLPIADRPSPASTERRSSEVDVGAWIEMYLDAMGVTEHDRRAEFRAAIDDATRGTPVRPDVVRWAVDTCLRIERAEGKSYRHAAADSPPSSTRSSGRRAK